MPVAPATRVQVSESKRPLGKVTVPDGLVGLVSVSVTVTVHVETSFTTTGLSQLRVVEV